MRRSFATLAALLVVAPSTFALPLGFEHLYDETPVETLFLGTIDPSGDLHGRPVVLEDAASLEAFYAAYIGAPPPVVAFEEAIVLALSWTSYDTCGTPEDRRFVAAFAREGALRPGLHDVRVEIGAERHDDVPYVNALSLVSGLRDIVVPWAETTVEAFAEDPETGIERSMSDLGARLYNGSCGQGGGPTFAHVAAVPRLPGRLAIYYGNSLDPVTVHHVEAS